MDPLAMTVIEIEEQRRREQDRLDRLKTPGKRNRLGQYATSPALALDIARFVWERWNGRFPSIAFLEPALGTGAFYSALLQTVPPEVVETAVGVELDPVFAAAATDLWSGSGLQVIEANFTAQRPEPCFNLILTNPPYVRHHHLEREEKERLKAEARDRLQIDLSGLAGLYCHFLLVADAWLVDGGIAAWLIPSEFMDVNYGAAVKEYLTDHVTLLHIHRFCPSDVQFGDALVTSAVVVFEKTPPPDAHGVRFSFGGSILRPESQETVPLASLRAAPKWTRFPNEADPGTRDADTLGDCFTIKRGLATGANSFFILEREDAARRGIPDAFLKPILPSPRHLRQDVIEAEADGYPRLPKPLSLIDCNLPEDEIRERHPEFWAYLEDGKRREIHTGYLASRRVPWYSQEKRDPAPFLCTYMGRQGSNGNPFRFFWNKSKATAANVYLLLYPKGELKRALDARPELYPVVWSLLQEITPANLIGEGRVYGGGLFKLEPKELAQLSSARILGAIDGRERAKQQTLGFLTSPSAG